MHTYLSGGGMHNPVLLKRIIEILTHSELHSIEELGMNPHAKKAMVFAVLTNEMLCNEGLIINTGSNNRINFGKISFPD